MCVNHEFLKLNIFEPNELNIYIEVMVNLEHWMYGLGKMKDIQSLIQASNLIIRKKSKVFGKNKY